MQIRGIIFDFNGVLVDDEPVHFHAFREALKEEGLTFSWEEYCNKYLPYDDHNFFVHFLRDQNRQIIPQHIHRLIEVKSHYYFKAIEQDVPVIEPSIDFLGRLPSGLHLAIASGAAKEEIEFILNHLRLRERFVTVIAASDVEHGKPHPEAFLKALDGLKEHDPTFDCHQVIVIEDSYHGIQSAHTAGMKCVALSTSYPREKLSEADLVLESLQGWTLKQLEDRLGMSS
ncbi:HAD family phosphatase [Acidobacteria bacterium AH-259-D05]|nr:HAD family phosphatase [Acidobacteria bacterium AH-259-D05]